MWGAKMQQTADSTGNAVGKALSVSEVTAIEYNRWMVEEEHKKLAEERKDQHNVERSLRKELRDKYVGLGAEHYREDKEAMKSVSGGLEYHRKQNHDKGSIVKAEVAELTKKMHDQQTSWQQHGSSLAQEFGSDQKRKVKASLTATTARKREKAQAERAQLSDLEKSRTERRNQAVDNRRELRELIQGQTSDAVTQEAKNLFFEQRKVIGDDTRSAMKKWKEERSKQQEKKTSKALEARAAAKAAQQAAKESIETVRAQRSQSAKEMRERKAFVEGSGAKGKAETKHNNKVVHDMMKSQMFVNPILAEDMKAKAGKRYAELTRSAPATGSAE